MIDEEELTEYLIKLGHKPRKATNDTHCLLRNPNPAASQNEVLNMIWELDVYQTSTIGWDEFKTMFERVRADKKKLEPRSLYNLVEFMTFDSDGSGLIDEEEIRQIFFFHHGLRGAQLDRQMRDFYDLRDDRSEVPWPAVYFDLF